MLGRCGYMSRYTQMMARRSGAEHSEQLVNNPWYLIPGLFVIVAVLCYNFGDGVRDAADPFSHR